MEVSFVHSILGHLKVKPVGVLLMVWELMLASPGVEVVDDVSVTTETKQILKHNKVNLSKIRKVILIFHAEIKIPSS